MNDNSDYKNNDKLIKTVYEKPKFVKIYGINRSPKWYKVLNRTNTREDIMVPATKEDILLWKLK